MFFAFPQRLIAVVLMLSCLLLVRRLLLQQSNALSASYPDDHTVKAVTDSTIADYTPSTSHKPSPRIRQITILDNNVSPKVLALQERAVEMHRKHGQRWRYPLDVKRREGDAETEDDPSLQKAIYARSIIMTEMEKEVERRADWIMWLDPQTVLLNPAIPLSLFLPPPDFPTIHAIGTKDWTGFHTGVFFLRVHEWTIRMLNDTIAFNADPTAFETRSGGFIWGFESPEYYESMLYQPKHWYNAASTPEGLPYRMRNGRGAGRKELEEIEDLRAGSMLVHTADSSNTASSTYYPYNTEADDLSQQASFKALKHYLQELHKSPHDYEVPLTSTFYPEEVETYWARARTTRALLKKAEDKLYLGETDELDVEALRRAEAELYQTFWEYGYQADGVTTQSEHLENIMEEL